MKDVKVLITFFAEQTNTHYMEGAEIKVPDDLFDRHGKDGTGFLTEIKEVKVKK